MKYCFTLLVCLLTSVVYAQDSLKQAPFFDDFDNNQHGWYEFDEKEATGKIEKGQLFFSHHRTKGSWSLWNTVKIDETKNFSIEAKIRFLGGFDKHGYGIIWGANDLENKYFFIVTSLGFYTIRKVEAGKIKDIKSWAPNVYINQGNNENTFTIKKAGNSMLFYINQELLFVSDNYPFFGDKIGFTLAHNMKIAVDYLKVTQ
ncbi:hypothetical protein [Microscilla marina]|uniref:3-keto-disaccharide hydrolase domain-containing protein n=1 Tax=Microscilla marina ATCC 23134 TaxID=313606 RepID=A1ZYG6_MICM2|nr:hypothetical protein [Microscilla marina]EAY24550.1 hypothetical protein M23134_06953 [Microscilla marina ATCC 23134]